MTKRINKNVWFQVGRRNLSSRLNPFDRSYGKSANKQMRQVIDNYRKLVEQIEEATPKAIYNALEPTFKKSQMYCPKDTGALRASGYLEITSFRGKPRVEMGYGKNGKPDYAAAVHENLEWRHKSPTQAKWLQRALEEDYGEILPRITAQMRF